MPDIKSFTVIGHDVKHGAYSVVWHFTTIEDHVEIGDFVVIGSHCYIGAFTTIGEGSRIQTGVFLPRHSKIGKDVFIGPHCCFTDDRFPQVDNHEYMAAPPILEDGCSIGAGAVFLPGVRVGRGAMVGAGAVVTKDVEEMQIVVGNPSRLLRMTAMEGELLG